MSMCQIQLSAWCKCTIKLTAVDEEDSGQCVLTDRLIICRDLCGSRIRMQLQHLLSRMKSQNNEIKTMKNQKKNSKEYYCNKHNLGILHKSSNRDTLKQSNGWKIVYNRRNRKYRITRIQAAPNEYVFYSILNTDIIVKQRIAISMITRSILALYNTLVADRAKNPYIDQWQKSGQNIIVLRGYNHKHLKYLEREAEYLALGKHAIYHRGYRSRIMLVLSIFGRNAEIEDIFDGLSYL